MKIYAPEYYKKFKCIADKCKHSCCIGWEIDIDGKTLDRYMKTEGEFGERLKKNISKGEESCFVLGEGERCPFLNENNLCDIYIELGEENLCQICSDHPRFRNFFDSRTELGVGLCCEAAVELILEWEPPFSLTVIDENDEPEFEEDEETVFFDLRGKAFDIIQNKSETVEECVRKLTDAFGVDLSDKSADEWIDFFLSLEILDPEWIEILKSARNSNYVEKDFFESPEGQNVQRQLLLYFIYRHTADGIYDGSFYARIGFAVLSLELIKVLCCDKGKADIDSFKDIARRYSTEIEYCEENIDRIIDMISLKMNMR